MNNRFFRGWRELFTALVFAVLFVVAGSVLFCERENLDVLSSLDTGWVIAILTLSACSLALVGVGQWILFRCVASSFRVGESVQVAIGLSFLNYLPAKAGLFGRGAYLHRVHGVSVSDYIGLTVRARLIALAGMTALGSLAGFSIVAEDAGIGLWAATGLAIVAGISASGYLYGGCVINWIESLPVIKRLSKYLRYRKQPLSKRLVVTFSGVVILAMLCRAARLYVNFIALGHPLDPTQAFVIEAVNAVTAFLIVVPGNLGFREGALVGLAAAWDVTWEVILSAALLDRLAMLAIPLVVGPWCTHKLSRRMLMQVS